MIKNYYKPEQKVVMYDGSVMEVKDLVVGDVLIGPDSKPRKVIDKSFDTKELVGFYPSRFGDEFYLGLSNDIALSSTGKNCAIAHGDKIETTVKEFLSLRKLRKKYLAGYRSGCIHWDEELTRGEELLLPCYYLGLWLGDGTARDTSITNMDKEVIEYLYDLAPKYGLHITAYRQGKSKRALMMRLSTKNRINNYLRTSLRKLNLRFNKHIPRVYMFASEEDRLKLLAGYLDTDGCLVDEYFVVASVLDNLAQETIFLARSLGFAVNSRKTKYGYNQTSISGDVQRIPAKIERKKAKDYKKKRDNLKFGFKTRKMKKQEVCGLQIEGDGLFLASDFTVLKAT